MKLKRESEIEKTSKSKRQCAEKKVTLPIELQIGDGIPIHSSGIKTARHLPIFFDVRITRADLRRLASLLITHEDVFLHQVREHLLTEAGRGARGKSGKIQGRKNKIAIFSTEAACMYHLFSQLLKLPSKQRPAFFDKLISLYCDSCEVGIAPGIKEASLALVKYCLESYYKIGFFQQYEFSPFDEDNLYITYIHPKLKLAKSLMERVRVKGYNAIIDSAIGDILQSIEVI